MENALKYFNNNVLAASVWASKYAMKDTKGKTIETTPVDMHTREATEFWRIEHTYGKDRASVNYWQILNHLRDFEAIIPQGSVMAVLGNPNTIGSLSNCIVLPSVIDSYGGIFYTDQQTAQVMKRRCGVGIDISNLRTKGSRVSNAAQTSTGAVSFMHRFSSTCREVAQDGRRGAEMITLHVNHPETEDFALVKQDLTKVTGANISLKITDEFMTKVKKEKPFVHRFPVDNPAPERLNGFMEDVPKTVNGVTYVRKDSKKLWNTIVKAAHNTAEPGLLFWDRQHYYSTSSLYPEFVNIATNPCAEIAMGNDSCRLISKNIMSCVVRPFTKEASFDFDKWYGIAYDTMKLMDNLVDLELESIERIINKIKTSDKEPDHIKAVELQTWEQLYNTGKRGRRTGSGFTALGDALAALGIKYSSDEGIKMAQEIAKVQFIADLDATIDMAEDRGAFPAFDATLEAKWAEDESTMFYMIKEEFPDRWERMQRVGRRNISWSTIAPNGSLSLLALVGRVANHKFFGTTSGIEPLFSVYHIRKKKLTESDINARVDEVDALGDKWQYFPVFHEGFKMWWVIASQYQHAPEKALEILENMTKDELEKVIAESPYAGSTAPEIDWKQRVNMQAALQKYITHSISSTINLPNNVTVEEVSDIYFYAWEAGLKGITIYRDGCRSGVLVTDTPKKEKEDLPYHDAPKRPKNLNAEYTSITVKGNKYGVVTGLLNGKPYEVFAFQVDKEWDDFAPKSKGSIIKEKKGVYSYIAEGDERITIPDIGNLASHADEQMLTRLVSGMMRHGVNPKFIVEQIDKCPLEIVSFGSALKRVLKKYLSEKDLIERSKCKDCGSTNLRHEEGCSKCLDCGSSKCG